MDILTIYQFCTFGGVERVLLNRAMAFKSFGLDVVIHAAYLQDFGALDSFKNYIKVNKLEHYLIPFLMNENDAINEYDYQLITIIDTPQVFSKILSFKNVVVECHTAYIENRQYLNDLPESIRKIIVPGHSFRSLINKEFPKLPEIVTLTNTVSDEFFDTHQVTNGFAQRPLTLLSRMDALKNVIETMDLFHELGERKDIFFMIIGNSGPIKLQIENLEQREILNKTFIREKISFHEVPNLTSLVRQERGVFISSSKGESFGLSAAEFIARGVPVLLSNIPAHADLVDRDERFLYPLGDIRAAKTKLGYLLDNWDSISPAVSAYGEKFRYAAFIDNWTQLIKALDISTK